jgi:hypothetical protein
MKGVEQQVRLAAVAHLNVDPHGDRVRKLVEELRFGA